MTTATAPPARSVSDKPDVEQPPDSNQSVVIREHEEPDGSLSWVVDSTVYSARQATTAHAMCKLRHPGRAVRVISASEAESMRLRASLDPQHDGTTHAAPQEG